MSYQDFPPSLLILSPRLSRAGNPSHSIVGINTTELADGSFVYCLETRSEYQLDKQDNSTVPDGVNVLAPLAGPGRWLLKLTNEGPGGPLDRTFYVSPNTNPTPDGSIENPFPDPAAAFAAIPAPIDAADAALTWAVICTPATYKLAAPLVCPPRSVALTAINYGASEFLFGVSVFLTDATGTTPIGIQVPTWSLLGSQIATLTMQGIVAGSVELQPAANGSVFFIGLASTRIDGFTKSGTNTLTLDLAANDRAGVGTIVVGASDLVILLLRDSNVTTFTGELDADGSFVGEWTPTGNAQSRCSDTEIGTLRAPNDPTTVVRLDSCEVTSVDKAALVGQYIFDSATLRSILSNSVSPEGIPVSVADAVSSQADFAVFDGATGDVTFAAGTLWLPNVIIMSPAVNQLLNLPDATSWQVPDKPGFGGRSLWIINRGAGNITIIPAGGDSTEVPVIAGGNVAVLTPVNTLWTKILVVTTL